MKKGISKYIDAFKKGDLYGMWTIVDGDVRFAENSTIKEYVVKVKCKCGTEKVVSCRRLLNGETRGCPCSIKGENNKLWSGVGVIPGAYLYQFKNSAKKRKISVEVDDSYLWKLYENQDKKCALSSLPISFGDYKHKHTASLDRIDSSKGYVKGNIQWVHKDINIMKNTFSVEEFRKLCKLVCENEN
jgi:hypothetical protein